MSPQSRKFCINIKSTTSFLDGLNNRPLSFVPWRYLNILFTAVLCDTLVLFVNREHWWTAKDISGLVFDAKYNIIPITESYELGQFLLASEPFTSVPRGASTLVGVGNPLECYIPMDSKTLRINPVWQNWNQSLSNVLISMPKNSDTDSHFECYQL